MTMQTDMSQYYVSQSHGHCKGLAYTHCSKSTVDVKFMTVM